VTDKLDQVVIGGPASRADLYARKDFPEHIAPENTKQTLFAAVPSSSERRENRFELGVFAMIRR
jgi:hypothetical protein